MPAGAFALHYSYSTPPPLWSGGLQVVQWWGARKFASRLAEINEAGGEVLQYVLPVHDYPGNYSEVEPALFYTGAAPGRSTNLAWCWDKSNPNRVKVPNYDGRVMDMRVGSAWVNHLINNYFPKIAAQEIGYKYHGIFLDVTGDGYFGQITGLTTSEKDEYSAGIRDFVKRLRALVGDNLILIGNNAWAGPIDYIDGMMIENHGGSEIGNTYWRGQLNNIIRTKRRRNVTINRTSAEAVAWSNVVGVDAAGAQNNNYQIAVPVSGISTSVSLPNHYKLGSGTPNPNPNPGPTPLPVPTIPTGLTVTPTGEPGQLLVRWTASPAAEQVTFYQVYVNDSLSAPSNLRVSKTATEYTITGLTDGVEYRIRVSAQNGPVDTTGYGQWSVVPVLGTPFDAPEPPPDGDDYQALYEAALVQIAALENNLAEAQSTITDQNELMREVKISLTDIDVETDEALARFPI